LKTADFNVTFMASGGGGNFKYIVQNSDPTLFNVMKLITDRNCEAERVSKILGIENSRVDRILSSQNFGERLLDEIPSNTDLIVLAGFLSIIPQVVLDSWQQRIINIHPSLLPKHGGAGLYGVKVHDSVIRAKESVTGCTIHFVDDKIDHGEVIAKKEISVPSGISAWDLGAIVHKIEGPLLLDTINQFALSFPK
jgi:phosphoribosylglycinamide formyltransferase-1